MAATATQDAVHVHRLTVRFGDCDPAGIVYFPRFFDFFHLAMESWFDEVLGLPYERVIVGRKIGFPAVHTDADFVRPSAFGDRLAVELRVGKVGTKSVELRYAVRHRGEAQPRVTGSTVVVVMDLDPQSPGYRRAIPVPDDLRTRIEQFAAGSLTPSA